ncbi:hypothetical protein ES708_16474 [subsurface metagenome]
MKQGFILSETGYRNVPESDKTVRLVFLICFFLTAGILSSQNSSSNTDNRSVEALIKSMVDMHHSVLSAEEQVEAARMGLEQQYMFFLPFSANIGTNTYGSLTAPDFNISASFDISYTIFDWKTIQEVKRLKILEEVSVEYEKSVRQIVMYKLCNMIITWISSMKNYNLAFQDYDSIKSYTEKMQQRFDMGDISKTELDFANGRLLKADGLVVQSEYAIREAEHLFKAETGETFSDGMKDIQFSVNTFLATESDKLIAIQNRPDIKQSVLLISALQQEKNSVYSNTIPVIRLTTSLKYPFDNPNAWQAGLNFTIPLSSIKYDKLRDQQYSVSLKSKEHDLALFIENSMANLLVSEEKIRNLKKVLEINRKALKYAEQAVEGVLIEFKAGVRTSFDVIDAQNTFSTMSYQVVSNEIELLKAELNYQYALGGLNFEQ